MNTKLAGLLLILLVVATVSACASTLPPEQVSMALPATPHGAASSVIDTFVVTDSAVKWNEYTHPEWGLIFD